MRPRAPSNGAGVGGAAAGNSNDGADNMLGLARSRSRKSSASSLDAAGAGTGVGAHQFASLTPTTTRVPAGTSGPGPGTGTGTGTTQQQPATAYFLADEKTIEEAVARSDAKHSTHAKHTSKRAGGRPQDSSYGVQSLAETIGGGASAGGERGKGRDEDYEDEDDDDEHEEDEGASASVLGSSPERPKREDDAAAAMPGPTRPPQPPPHPSLPPAAASSLSSRPLTPISLVSPVPGSSLASSPRSTSTKSLRPADDLDSGLEDTGSQALASSGDESEGEGDEGGAGTMGHALQLIMPSIKMPSRRPFTERGRNMGRLKVLVSGRSGVGKTALIRSIVQTCEDIVHVDPLMARSPSLSKPPPRRLRTSNSHNANGNAKDGDATRTTEITEIHASTRAYPAWWSEFDQGKILRRRKSLGDTVLERNLCFVDTPGYANGISTTATSLDAVLGYVTAQMERTASLMGAADGDALGLLSGNGGSQVDVMLYVVADKMNLVDVEFLRRLSPLINVIPVIAKAETQSPEAIAALKSSVLQEMHNNDVQPFLFGKALDEALRAEDPCPPFAISCATTSDADNMDASLLMSPDYMQPLVPTELQTLVERVFERDSIAWLRHAAALKFVQWRRQSPGPYGPPSRGLSSPHSPNGPSPSSETYPFSMLKSHATYPSTSSPTSPPPSSSSFTSSYALARVADHTQREERLAQVRLARWADELQRSLTNERRRFEALARGEHALWLKDRLDERLLDGTLTLSAMEESMALVRQQQQQQQQPRPRRASLDDLSGHWGSGSGSGSGTDDRLVKMGAGAASPRPRYGERFHSSSAAAPLRVRDPLGLLELNDLLWRRGWMAVKTGVTFGVVSGLVVWFARWSAGGFYARAGEWLWEQGPWAGSGSS